MGVTPSDRSALEAGRAARASGLLLTAVQHFETVVETEPDTVDGYVELAGALRELRLTTTAQTRLAPALRRWPERWDVNLEAARLAATDRKFDRALEYYERVLRLTPHTIWAEPYVGAARQLRRLQRFADAETLLDRALELCAGRDLQEQLLLTERALLQVATGSYRSAKRTLQELIRSTGSHHTVWEAAQLFAENHELEAALSLIRSLRNLVHEHCADTLTYDRYAEAIAGAARLAFEIDRACEQNPLLDVLLLYPLAGVAEEPAEQLPERLPSIAGTVRYYFPSTGSPELPARPKDLPLHLDDADWLFPWPVARGEMVHFTSVVLDAHIFDNLGTDSRSMVLHSSGAYLEDLVSPHYPAVLERRAARDRRCLREPAIETAFVLPSIGGWYNYYHALVDILASLEVYLQLGLDCPIVAPGSVSDLHAEIISACGIAPSTPLSTSHELNGRPIRQAICPEPPRGDLLRRWCRRIVDNLLGSSSTPIPGHVLYVSRTGAPNRKLANESLLEARLARRFHAEVAHMESLSFTDQVTLARRASILVGPHGAGLANMAFMRPGSWVVELVPARYAVGVFRSLATELGLGYLAVEGPVHDTASLEWAVSLDVVENILQSLVEVAD